MTFWILTRKTCARPLILKYWPTAHSFGEFKQRDVDVSVLPCIVDVKVFFAVVSVFQCVFIVVRIYIARNWISTYQICYVACKIATKPTKYTNNIKKKYISEMKLKIHRFWDGFFLCFFPLSCPILPLTCHPNLVWAGVLCEMICLFVCFQVSSIRVRILFIF